MRLTTIQTRQIVITTRQTLKRLLQKPEAVFVCIALPFGIVMSIVMQLFMAPDESVHFYRAYQVSQGHMVSESRNGVTGGLIPEKIVQDVEHNFSTEVRLGGDPPLPRLQYFIDRSDQNEVFTKFPSSALYSPVAYIPQAVGIAVGKAIHPSTGVMMVMGRLFNLAAFVLLVYVAIRIARQGKWVYVVAGLFPMAIQQASSLSSDVMTTGLVFVFLALVHRCFTQVTHLKKWQYVLFVSLAIGIAMTKQTNVVLLLPILFLPKRLFGSIWHKLRFIAAVGGAAVIAALAWYAVLKFGHYNLQISGEPGVDQAGQIAYLVSHPLNFLFTFFSTYIYEGFRGMISTDFYWISAYGVFSWISYKLPLSLIIVGYIMLFVALLNRDGEHVADQKKLGRLVLIQFATIVLAFVAIALALYLTWTPVAKPQVWGIQGRYFIALIPLLIPLFVFAGRWVKISFSKPYYMGVLVSVVSCINLGAMIVLTYKWFY